MYERLAKYFGTAVAETLRANDTLIEIARLKKKNVSTRIHIWKELRMNVKKRHCPACRTFEVSVININVLNALKNNEEHPKYSDRWAEVQRTVILAADEIELSEKISRQYPVTEGFVVKNISEFPRAHLI